LKPETRERLRATAGPAAAAVFGVAWFLWETGGRAILSPFRLEPLMIEDWSTHVLGWLFYRNEPLRFPLGAIESWLYPAGTTLGYTDSIPWLGFLFRPFSRVLPADFQYIGMWLLLCFAAQGAMAAVLMKLASNNPLHQALGGSLLAAVPTLRVRAGHASLCAHAALLALIWLHARPYRDPNGARRSIFVALLVNVLLAGIHPYLAAMVAVLTIALALRFRFVDRALSSSGFAMAIAAVCAIQVGFAFLLGYLGTGTPPGVGGFGFYASDLSTFVNPGTYSRWLPRGSMGTLAYEGFAYVGIGALGVIAFALAALRGSRWRALPWSRVLPLTCAALCMGAFAVSWTVRVFGHVLIDLGPNLHRLERLIAPFRSSGRFIWPLHYCLVAGALLIVLRSWSTIRPHLLSAALAILLAAQVGESTVPALVPPHEISPGKMAWNTLLVRYDSPRWAETAERYRHLALFPAEVVGSGCEGRNGYRKSVVVSLAYLAYRHRLTFNSGYVARLSPRVAQRCNAELTEVGQGKIDPQTVYVISEQDRQLFTRAGGSCGLIDGLLACVRPAMVDPVAEYLRAHPG
jgi:hypothetical protein